MKYGRLPVKHDPRTLRFARYATNLAPPPPSYSNLTRVYLGAGVSDPTVLFPMDGNDVYGDCTWAGKGHFVAVFQGLIGKETIVPSDVVVNGYLAFTDGQDTGCNELDVLNDWRKTAFGGDTIYAYVSVGPTNRAHVQQAIRWFGGLYIGMLVTTTCQDQFTKGQPWTSGTLIPDEGHCVVVTDYNADGVTLLTWGNTQKATWDWWDQCVEEAYAILPPEAQTTGYSDFDFAQLQQDLADVTG